LKLIAAIALMTLMTGGAHADEVHLSMVASLAPVECKVADVGWVFNTMGSCRDFEAPTRIMVGATFSESGTLHVIRVISDPIRDLMFTI
jgi:hypothetical protein